MSSIDKEIFIKEKKTKKSKMIATIVAVSVIAVATIGLVVGLVVGKGWQIKHEVQAEGDRIADQLLKPNPDNYTQ